MSYTIHTKAFTLIELLVVVAIISLLSSVVIVSLQDAREKARNQSLVGSAQQMINGLELYNQDHDNTYPGEASPGTVTEGFIYYEITKNSDGSLVYFDNAQNVGNLTTLLEPYFNITSFSQHLKPGESIIYFWDPDHMCVGQTTTPRFMILLPQIETSDRIPNLLLRPSDIYADFNCLSI
jgi:prepilin-type N-terminal cleavage/methylation domain-containing protein